MWVRLSFCAKKALAGAKSDPQAEDGYGQHNQQSKEEIDPIGLGCILPDGAEKNHPQTGNHKNASENGKYPTRALIVDGSAGITPKVIASTKISTATLEMPAR